MSESEGLVEFTIRVAGGTRDEVIEMLETTTAAFLKIAGSYDPNPWECLEESLAPATTWTPGIGPTGKSRGWKGYRKFVKPID